MSCSLIYFFILHTFKTDFQGMEIAKLLYTHTHACTHTHTHTSKQTHTDKNSIVAIQQ